MVEPEDRRAIGEDISAQVVRAWVDTRREAGDRVSDEDEQRLLDAVLAYLFGLGRLQAITGPVSVITRTPCRPRLWPPSLCTVTPEATSASPSWNTTLPE